MKIIIPKKVNFQSGHKPEAGPSKNGHKPELSIETTKSQFKTARVWARSRDVSPDMHYLLTFAFTKPPRRKAPAHMLTNSLHEQELVQLLASLLNSEK